jgi:hypothetical protein
MSLEIHPDSHLDHGITPAVVAWLLDRYKDRDGFFAETVGIPADASSLTCGLYGPAMGDEPVPEANVRYEVRGSRQWASRCVACPQRPTRYLTVIAGPHDGKPCVLYTAHGGPMAPREVGDTSLTDGAERDKSRAFWAEHALAV